MPNYLHTIRMKSNVIRNRGDEMETDEANKKQAQRKSARD